MNHILMECPLNQGKEIWNHLKQEWERKIPKAPWLKPTIELVRGLGSVQLKNQPKWINEAYIERISEAVWLIWSIRNNRVFNKKEIPKAAAIRMLKEALETKKELEWIYITKIKGLSKRDKRTKELEKKWGKRNEAENEQRY